MGDATGSRVHRADCQCLTCVPYGATGSRAPRNANHDWGNPDCTCPACDEAHATRDRAAKPEDFTHSWLMCRETGEIALSKNRGEAKCPAHDSTSCLGTYVPIEEARRA